MDNETGIIKVSKGSEELQIDRHPVAVYLARLGSPVSRYNMKFSLEKIAELASGGRKDALSFEWEKLRYPHVQGIRTRLAELYSPASANRHLAALRGVLKECWRLNLMSSQDYERARDFEPVKGERLPKGRSLSHRELRSLFETAADGSLAGVRNAALLAVLYAAGLRRSEIVALSFSDWNEAEASLKVRGKGNKERLVYLNNGSLEAFQAWLKVRGKGAPSDPVFVSFENFNGEKLTQKRMSSRTVLAALDTLARKAEVASFSPHDLRRSFISDLLDAGADIVTVQKMAGHSQVQTTSRYDRRGEEAKSRAAKLLRVPFVPAQ